MGQVGAPAEQPGGLHLLSEGFRIDQRAAVYFRQLLRENKRPGAFRNRGKLLDEFQGMLSKLAGSGTQQKAIEEKKTVSDD